MPNTLRSVPVRLPNGLDIEAPSELEAAMVYREIFVDRTYRQQGIVIPPNGVVFDVGANIGLFAIELAQTVPGVRVHSFEPLPDVHALLVRNTSRHAPETTLHNVALGAQAGEAAFRVDPNMTIASSMYPEVFDTGANRGVTAWAAAAIDDLDRAGQAKSWMRMARRGLDRAWTRPFALAALTPLGVAAGVRQRLATKHVTCPVTTLSEVIAGTGVPAIDLLKIDVEGAEEAVLEGLAESDWPRVRQLVIEVHDVGGRLARLTSALQARGYRTVSTREDWATHELLRIQTLYALSGI